MSKTIFLSLGSNLGNRELNLATANRMISNIEGFETINHSPIYISAAVEMGDNAPGFFNMVIEGTYKYRPLELLNNLEDIEKKMGREEKDKGKYRPRIIDLDILLFNNEVVKIDRLSIPHRKMIKRPFVLVPLLQIDRDLIHPVTKERIDKYVTEADREKLILYQERDRITANV